MHTVHMDMNLLVAFDALMQTKSVNQAARLLGLSQPATSHALARLRRELNDPILIRSNQGMVPTARAELMHPPIRAALASLRSAVEAPQAFDPRTSTRRFVIDSADYGQLAVLPPLVKAMSKSAPFVDLTVGKEIMFDGLRSGASDLAIAPPRFETAPAGLKSRVLFNEGFVVLMRKGHPLLRGKLTLERYAKATHAFVAPRGTLGGVVDDVLAKQELTRRIALMVPQFLVVPHTLVGSDLICTLPTRLANRFCELLPLKSVVPPCVIPGFAMAMVWHERVDRDPSHVWLRQQLIAAVQG